MNRRDTVLALASLGAVPALCSAQQPALPVIGMLGSESPAVWARHMRAFHEGLGEMGYVDGRNVAIEYRWADGHNDRLPALAGDLVRRRVSVIAAPGSTPSTLAAKAATSTIPIVFWIGSDPRELGIVANMNRPEGNLTGVTTLNHKLVAKRVELVHEVVLGTRSIALLVNPTSPNLARTAIEDAHAAAGRLSLELHVLNASAEADFDAVFAKLVQLRVGGLVIGTDAFFTSRLEKLASLALRHRVPAVYHFREFAAAGGLISYGGSIADAFRETGVYAGRILGGEKPANLPVQQVTKVDLYVNLKTAKALGVTVPNTLLARADEVIEWMIVAACVHLLALAQDARAADVLDAAHDELMAIASGLADAALRQGFLEHIPEHREIRAAWAAARASRADPPGTWRWALRRMR